MEAAKSGKKDSIIMVKVSVAERQELDEAARMVSASGTSTFMRMAALAEARRLKEGKR